MKVLPSIKQDVLGRIREEDVIELSRELIRIPSETGHEKQVSEFLLNELRGMGLEATGVEAEAERPNVVARWRGSGDGPTVMFSGHMDTVGTGDPSAWSVDPYGGEVIDGKLYGRGAMDSKGGGLASILVALRALQAAGVQLRGDVLVVGTVDEEVGGRKGMQYLVGSGAIQPDLVVYCVHSDMEIKAHFKGVAWLHWSVRGQTAHGSMPHKGVNAITRAARLIARLEPGLPYEPHPILGQHTVNFGWIRAGGEKPRYNVVSDGCEFGVDMRLVPGQSTDFVERSLQDLIGEMQQADPALDASFSFYTRREPRSVREDEPILQMVKAAATEVMGRAPVVGGTISTGDLTAILDKGIPGVGFGPGDLERGNAHKQDEFIEVDQLLDATRIYALVMMEACGTD